MAVLMTRVVSNSRDQITALLRAWSRGDEDALDRLTPLVHDKLVRLAASFLRRENSDHSLQTTALVNEAFLGLVHQDRVQWKDRAHFFAIAGRIMRRILVDHARSKGYQKRGGGWQRLPERALQGLEMSQRGPELVALDDALQALEEQKPDLVRIVELRFFGGLQVDEMVAVTGLSSTTLNRRWRLARAWLRREMGGPSQRYLGASRGSLREDKEREV